MSTESLYIAYDGPALTGHEIDVRIIAPALLALSDLFEETNKVLNGDRAQIHLNLPLMHNWLRGQSASCPHPREMV